MRHPVILPRVWLLVALFRGAGGGWRHPTRAGGESFVYGFDDGRRRTLDLVPPTMLKLYDDEEARVARSPNSVVRSFHDQGHHHHRRCRPHHSPVPAVDVRRKLRFDWPDQKKLSAILVHHKILGVHPRMVAAYFCGHFSIMAENDPRTTVRKSFGLASVYSVA